MYISKVGNNLYLFLQHCYIFIFLIIIYQLFPVRNARKHGLKPTETCPGFGRRGIREEDAYTGQPRVSKIKIMRKEVNQFYVLIKSEYMCGFVLEYVLSRVSKINIMRKEVNQFYALIKSEYIYMCGFVLEYVPSFFSGTIDLQNDTIVVQMSFCLIVVFSLGSDSIFISYLYNIFSHDFECLPNMC